MGSTAAGKVWCLKALNPADPLTECDGVPDQSDVPSVFMNYQTVTHINPTTIGTNASWGFDAMVTPHPTSFMTWKDVYPDGTYDAASHQALNPMVSGVDMPAKDITFMSTFKRWRLAYMSVTVYQDGPALADQGTLVCAQVPFDADMVNLSSMDVAGNPLYGGNSAPVQAYRHIRVFTDDEDAPSYDASQSMPNAYFGKSKDGLYSVMKMTRTSQVWRTAKDEEAWTFWPGGVAGPTKPLLTLPMYTANAAQHCVWPFPIEQFGIYEDATPVFKNLWGRTTSPLLNDVVTHISARNISPQTSFAVYIRCGIQAQAGPKSLLASQLTLPPIYDSQALEAYYLISRELKDGYPADYNDLGKIWDAIKSAASTVAPFLMKMGGVPAAIGAAIPSISTIVDSIAKRLKPTVGNTVSEAEKQVVRQVLQQPVPKSSKRRGPTTSRRK